MKTAKCSLSNETLCAMAAAVLGLFGISAFFAAVAAKRHCMENKDCLAENLEQHEE